MVDWSDGPLHRIVLPMVDNHRKLSGHNRWETQKPSGNHRTPNPFHSMVMVALKMHRKIVMVR